MRLIDAEPLEKKFKGWIEQIKEEYPFAQMGDIDGVESCLAELEDAPTIDFESGRRVAHWRTVRCDQFSCSNCDCDVFLDLEGSWNIHDEYEYCPYCGAKMEEPKK